MTQLAASIDAALARFGRRLFAKGLLRWLLIAAAVHGLLVLVATHLDRFLFLDDAVRRGLSVAVLGVPVAVLAAGVGWLAVTRPDRRQLAYRYERSTGLDFSEAVVTAEALAGQPHDAAAPAVANPVRDELVAELMASATQQARDAGPRARAVDPWLSTALLTAAGVAAAWGVLAAWPAWQFPLMLERTYLPWRDLPKPSFTRIKVVPDTIQIGRGDELVLQAEIAGEMPWLVERLMHLLGSDTRRCLIEIPGRAPAEMTRVHRRLFLTTRGDVREPFEFRIRCGDARTRLHAVDVVTQPAVASLAITLTPPAYTGRALTVVETARQPLKLLVGSQAAVVFQADQELEAVEVTVDGQAVPGFTWDAAARTGRFTIEVADSQEITIDLVNRQGFHAVRPTVISIEALTDQKPVVQLEAPAAETEQVPAALVPLRATVEDDLAVTTAVVIWQLNPHLDADAPLRELPLELAAAAAPRVSIEAAVDLDVTKGVPGDEIVAFVRARDSAGNDGDSAPLTIRVVSFTRGENERQRLATLRWLAAAAPAVMAAGGRPLAEDAVVNLRDAAKKLGLPDDLGASLPAVLALLEREVYLSETSSDKQDAIAVHGLLAAGTPVPGEIFMGLAGRRRLENVIVRLFGMRAEAERLAAALGQEPDMEAIGRRASLGLKTLEQIGGDLLDLARDLPAAGLSESHLVDLQTAVNEAGYSMTRGSVAKRAAACGRLAEGISGIVAAIKPAAAPLLSVEADARKQVAALLNAVGAGLVQPQAGTAAGPNREWFRRRLGLLNLDPFAAGFDILSTLAVASGNPPPALAPPVVAAEREWWQWLSAEWERERLSAVAGMAADERATLGALLAARLPASPPQVSFKDSVDAVAAAALPLVTEPEVAAQAIVAAAQTVVARAPADPVARAAAMADFDRAVDLAVMTAAARSRVAQLSAGGSFAADALLLRLRDAVLRYRQNVKLAAADGTADADGWQRPLKGLEVAIGKLLTAAAAGELVASEAVERSPFLVAARETRALRDAAATADRQGLVAGWPAAADLVLSQGVSLLVAASAAVAEADRLLAGETPDPQAWQRLRADIDRGIDGFAALAAGMAELASPQDEVQAKLAALDRTTGWDPAGQRGRRLALSELAPALGVLERRAAAVAERADADPGGFEGGPEQVWGEASQREALVGRRMVVDAWRAARRRGVTTLLGESAPPEVVTAEALPWSAFALRLGLSELGGAARGGGRQRQQEAKGDPLVTWLRREIDQARKAVRSGAAQDLYQKATLEYLDAVDDLLRY